MIEIQKEWAAVRGEKIVLKRETKGELLTAMRDQEIDESTHEIVALPKAHGSIFL